MQRIFFAGYWCCARFSRTRLHMKMMTMTIVSSIRMEAGRLNRFIVFVVVCFKQGILVCMVSVLR